MEAITSKIAVVTGAATGIGRGIARALAADGANVVVADIEREPAERVAAELAERGVRSLAVACDVADRGSVEALADRAWSEFGHVDILCNNAGVFALGAVANTPPADLDWVFSVNVLGVWNGCSVFVPRFKQRGTPTHILNTGSEHSLGIPFAGMGIYTAAKHAVLGLSDVMRRELEPHGIGVSILCPAVVNTEIWNAGRNRHEQYGGAAPSLAELREFMAAAMDPDVVGRLAVDGIRRGDFYILSHPEIRPMVEERYRELLAAFDAAEARAADDE
jgi:NAD(P)-dependent dehydrogenase (short-subunit alcohol dehydrogenase family)